MSTKDVPKHKFLEDSRMTFRQVFDFAFKAVMPEFQGLAKEIGEERFSQLLKRTALECGLRAGEDRARQSRRNDLTTFIAPMKEPDHFSKHVLTFEIVEDATQAFGICVTECLWAKTFRELGVAELGYLLVCHPDYAVCQGFSSKITLTRTKTLMQGDDCCNHRWVWAQ